MGAGGERNRHGRSDDPNAVTKRGGSLVSWLVTPPLVHWDDEDVPSRERTFGHIGGRWWGLGEASGSVGIGLRRMQIPPGLWSTPAHVHGREEEIFFVLGGSGISWQDGNCYEIGDGDCLVHLPSAETHTLRAGPDGIDVLAFGMRRPDDTAHLPRAGVAWLTDYRTWVEVGGPHPFEREAAVGPPELSPPKERPPTIVHVDQVEGQEREGETVARTYRDLGHALGSRTTGMRFYEGVPGKLTATPHCHSAEEELFVVLGGEGTLILGEEEHPVRRGHVVSRPPGTKVAHAFRAGENGLTVLAYGTREPNDIAFYPRSGKVAIRGVGVIGRLEQLDYWDGED
jgi:uncharacterized cupin superfamily protein